MYIQIFHPWNHIFECHFLLYIYMFHWSRPISVCHNDPYIKPLICMFLIWCASVCTNFPSIYPYTEMFRPYIHRFICSKFVEYLDVPEKSSILTSVFYGRHSATCKCSTICNICHYYYDFCIFENGVWFPVINYAI